MILRPHFLLIAGLAVAVLAGCSAAPGGSDAAPSAAPPSPLASYNNALNGVQDSKDYFAQADRIQNAITACMRDQGFDYAPVDTSKLVSIGEAAPHADTAHWAATYGYGINHAPDSSASDSVDPSYVNPNDAIVATLSGAELDAYNVALSGSGTAGGSPNSDTVVAGDSGDGGCQGKAEKKNPTPDPTHESQFSGLIEQSQRIPQLIAQDPGVVALDADWASCMADSGFPAFTSPASAQQSIEDSYNDYYSSLTGSADPSTVASMSQTEIETASADFACRQKVDYTRIHDQVRNTLEQRFVDDNKKDLEALVASYGGGN